VWAHAPPVCDCLKTDDAAGFVCSHIKGVHTLTLRLIKEKIRRNLRPYPSTLGWARRIGRVFGLTSRIDIDYIFDLANRRGRDVFFLQVGANDGLMDDPIHFLVRKYGWCGVLLEPDPQLFERLKENYSGVDGPILVNAALSPINGKTTFYRIRMDEKMPNWCALLGSFRREVILSNKNDVPEIETHIVEDRIESISFHSLVARYKPPRIDLRAALSQITRGADRSIEARSAKLTGRTPRRSGHRRRCVAYRADIARPE